MRAMTGAGHARVTKKVSCASLAGCCCGWNRASKFQKLLSTYALVGISSNPIWVKIFLNCVLTCRQGAPGDHDIDAA